MVLDNQSCVILQRNRFPEVRVERIVEIDIRFAEQLNEGTKGRHFAGWLDIENLELLDCPRRAVLRKRQRREHECHHCNRDNCLEIHKVLVLPEIG